MKAEDLWPGDVVRARAPGHIISQWRKIQSISFYDEDRAMFQFTDGTHVPASLSQELEPDEVIIPKKR